MFNGNPNRPDRPYAPTNYDQSPRQPGYTNPYHLGPQRTAGQLAPQPNRIGLGAGTNTTPRVPLRPQRPGGTGAVQNRSFLPRQQRPQYQFPPLTQQRGRGMQPPALPGQPRQIDDTQMVAPAPQRRARYGY